jgi:hypothetical protein
MKQEPVAWAEITKEYVAVSDEPFENATPLYTAPVQEDWYGQHQWQCGYERGWDAAMGKKENSLPLMQEGKDFTVSKPWVGLTDVELNTIIAYNFNASHAEIGREIEAKLKEKNT